MGWWPPAIWPAQARMYLTDGNIRHLDITPQQIFSQRPGPMLSGHRTPVDGLYLCGAGTPSRQRGGDGRSGPQRRPRGAGRFEMA